MRVRREVILVMGVLLFGLPAAAQGSDRAASPALPVELRPTCDLPFDLWPCFQNDRFLILSDEREFTPPVTEEFLDTFCGAFAELFRKAGFQVTVPKKPLVWVYIVNSQHYRNYSLAADGMDLSSLESYYSTQTNRVAFHWKKDAPSEPEVRLASAQTAMPSPPSEGTNDSLRKITHELAHQLAFNCGIQKSGVLYPLWVSEGLALHFEFGESADGQADRNAERRQRLVRLAKEGRLLPLEYMVTVSRLPLSKQDRRDLYAECWGFFYFLFHEYPDSFRDYVQYLYGLPAVYRSPSELLDEFEFYFGDIREYEQPWQAFLAGLEETDCRR